MLAKFCLIITLILLEFLQWLQDSFLGYLSKWEESVNQREGVSKDEKNRMLLSQETWEGLIVTSKHNELLKNF